MLIGKVDCVSHDDLCNEYLVTAYPTLKFFVDGEEAANFNGHRTVVEMAHFIENMEKEHKGKEATVKTRTATAVATERTITTQAHEQYARALSAGRHRVQHTWVDDEHPGCNIYGYRKLFLLCHFLRF